MDFVHFACQCPVWDKFLHSSHICNYSDGCYFPSLSYSFICFLKKSGIGACTTKPSPSDLPTVRMAKKKKVGDIRTTSVTNSLFSTGVLDLPHPLIQHCIKIYSSTSGNNMLLIPDTQTRNLGVTGQLLLKTLASNISPSAPGSTFKTFLQEFPSWLSG